MIMIHKSLIACTVALLLHTGIAHAYISAGNFNAGKQNVQDMLDKASDQGLDVQEISATEKALQQLERGVADDASRQEQIKPLRDAFEAYKKTKRTIIPTPPATISPAVAKPMPVIKPPVISPVKKPTATPAEVKPTRKRPATPKYQPTLPPIKEEEEEEQAPAKQPSESTSQTSQYGMGYFPEGTTLSPVSIPKPAVKPVKKPKLTAQMSEAELIRYLDTLAKHTIKGELIKIEQIGTIAVIPTSREDIGDLIYIKPDGSKVYTVLHHFIMQGIDALKHYMQTRSKDNSAKFQEWANQAKKFADYFKQYKNDTSLINAGKELSWFLQNVPMLINAKTIADSDKAKDHSSFFEQLFSLFSNQTTQDVVQQAAPLVTAQEFFKQVYEPILKEMDAATLYEL